MGVYKVVATAIAPNGEIIEGYVEQGKPGETIAFAGFVEYTHTFNISFFKKIRKYLCDFFKGAIIGRIMLHKELPFIVFCSMDFDVCP